jgi:hypothetical protein
MRLDAFYIFTHACFANPGGILTSGDFCAATQTLNRGLGVPGSIFQIGGSGSFRAFAKLRF